MRLAGQDQNSQGTSAKKITLDPNLTRKQTTDHGTTDQDMYETIGTPSVVTHIHDTRWNQRWPWLRATSHTHTHTHTHTPAGRQIIALRETETQKGFTRARSLRPQDEASEERARVNPARSLEEKDTNHQRAEQQYQRRGKATSR